MARSTVRVLALLEILQSGGTHTVAELARGLEVDRRTVRRYVAHLRELDIAVESVRGRYGGYRLARHHRFPPLMLTEEEALAVTWALLATGASASGPVSSTAVGSAAAKIRRVLPAPLARRVDAVARGVDFVGHAATSVPSVGPGPQVLLDVAEAARDRRPVRFDYTSGNGRDSHREVHPYGVVADRGVLYLAAHDLGRDAARTFRLDRIRNLRHTEGSFAAPEQRTALRQVLGPLPADSSRHDVSVLIEAGAAHVRQFFPELLASVEPVHSEPERVRVVVRAERLEWVAQRLAAVDRPFVVERPRELVEAIRALAHRLLTTGES